VIPAADNEWRLEGNNLVSKLFAGTANWLGHCMSDIAGSSGSRGKGEGHIGAGLPVPFTEFLQLCDFGRFPDEKGHYQSFATVMTEVYERGYDVRHGVATSVPVIVNELLVRMVYTFKKHFYEGKIWQESMPIKKDLTLNRMLTVGTGSLCLVDFGQAAVTSWGNWVLFFSKLNIVAWARFGMLGVKELQLIES